MASDRVRAVSGVRIDSQWQHPEEMAPGEIPAGIAPWLQDSGSLTQRLIELSGDRFQLTVLSQRVETSSREASVAMALPGPVAAVQREVCLHGRSQPWVYACSTIPQQTLDSNPGLRAHLGAESLGHWLFNSGCIREPLQAACLQPPCASVPAALRGAQALWARRSVFRLAGAPLLVCEVFLPAFPGYGITPP